MIGRILLQMKYLFALLFKRRKRKKWRDLKERVRPIVSSSTSFFFRLQECTRFGVPLARSSTH